MTTNPANSLIVRSITTRIFRQNESLLSFITESLPKKSLSEGAIIAITSKLVSLAEGNLVKRDESGELLKDRAQKKSLVQKEADVFLGETRFSVQLTLKHGLLLPSAGIDESNSESGDYILYPKAPYQTAAKLGSALRSHYGLSKLGIILTDSHTSPLRAGVTGIGLSHFGFKALRDLVGEKDLFGRELKATAVNVLDALAAAAVFEMGEADDARPIAIISGARGIEFTDSSTPEEIQIAMENDLYFQKLLGRA